MHTFSFILSNNACPTTASNCRWLLRGTFTTPTTVRLYSVSIPSVYISCCPIAEAVPKNFRAIFSESTIWLKPDLSLEGSPSATLKGNISKNVVSTHIISAERFRSFKHKDLNSLALTYVACSTWGNSLRKASAKGMAVKGLSTISPLSVQLASITRNILPASGL